LTVKAISKASIPPDLWYRAAVALIEQQPDTDRQAELRELFEHRAAIVEYDGLLPRPDAERIAFRELRTELGLSK
jgi:hypothetical protein